MLRECKKYECVHFKWLLQPVLLRGDESEMK